MVKIKKKKSFFFNFLENFSRRVCNSTATDKIILALVWIHSELARNGLIKQSVAFYLCHINLLDTQTVDGRHNHF